MGYSVELERSDLQCRSKADAEAAADRIHGDRSMSPYHLQVSFDCRSNPQDDASWWLEVEHFQGDHWPSAEAERLWLDLAPHMADGATIEFQGEGLDRWRIRWEAGRAFEEYVADVIWSTGHELKAEPKEIAP